MLGGVCLLDHEIWFSHPVGTVTARSGSQRRLLGCSVEGSANRGNHTQALPAPATSCRQTDTPSGSRSPSRACKLPRECQKILREGVPCGECYHSLVQPSHIILLLDLPSSA